MVFTYHNNLQLHEPSSCQSYAENTGMHEGSLAIQ